LGTPCTACPPFSRALAERDPEASHMRRRNISLLRSPLSRSQPGVNDYKKCLELVRLRVQEHIDQFLRHGVWTATGKELNFNPI
jgi:hypothetical protein